MYHCYRKTNNMANICTTNVDFYASSEAITWLDEQIQNIRKSDNTSIAFSDVFRLNEEEAIIDTLGSKWVTISDWGNNGTEYYLNLDSAWYYPKDLIERIVAKLQSMSEGSEFETPNADNKAMAKGRYFEENFDTIGVFETYDIGNTDSNEGSVDEDQSEWEEENPDGYFWDEVVEPIFEELEGDL